MQCVLYVSVISRKPSQNILEVKTFSNFKFYPSKLTSKTFSPNGVMLNFLCFFVLFIAVKINSKLTLHHMGKTFIF